MKRQVFCGALLSTTVAIGLGAQEPQSSQPTATRAEQSGRSAQTVTVTGCLQSGSKAAGAADTTGARTGAATSQSGQQAGGYILTNVSTSTGSGAATGAATTSPSGSPTGSTPGSPGSTPGSPGSSTTPGKQGTPTMDMSRGGHMASTYRLMGSDDQLRQYVGQRVEVTGTVSGGEMREGGKPSTGSATSPTGSTAGTPEQRGTPAGPPAGSSTGSTGARTGSSGSTMSSAQGQAASLTVTSVKPLGGTCSQ
jgi:hypothetical protein